jgi:pimeloyl-ACP methyl ester carboxylesterase
MTTAMNRSAANAHGRGVPAATHYRTATIDGLNIFYREAGPKDAPVVLLLHGFPSSSRMFRNLIPQLADAYHVIAPDYPAFGHSDTPDRAQFTYSFDHIAAVIDDLLDALGVRRFAPYMMDIGAAIGFRLAVKHPDAVWAIVAQNGPLYDEDGGAEFFAAMAGYWQDGSEEHRNAIRGFLTPESTRAQYLVGVADPSVIDPDSWLVDQALLDRPGVDEIMLDYLFEVRNRPATTNGVLEFLRAHQPPALIATGANDPLFPEANMRHYLDALPDGEFHALDTGHFALEDKGDEIAALMRDFLERVLATELGKTAEAIEARNDGSSTDAPTSRTHAPGEQP